MTTIKQAGPAFAADAQPGAKTGYKHTKLGWIPEEWEIKKLESVCLKIADGTHFSPKTSTEGAFRYITSRNIKDGYLDLTQVEWVTKEVHDEIYMRCDVMFGDVLLTKDGAKTGNACLNTLEEPFSLLSSAAFLRAHPEKATNEYLLQWIRSARGQWQIRDAMAGQAITRITLETLRGFELLFPPVEEQRRIAQVLGAWDRAIATVQELLAAQQERKRGLMQELLTGRRRFKGFGGKWVKRSIGEMIEESRIPVSHPDPERRITVRLHLGGVEHRQVRGTEAIDATGYFHRKAGQFIYGKQNLHKGAMGIVPRELNGFESTQDIPAFDFLTGTHPPFFLYLMSRPGWYPQLEKFATGTGSKRIHPEQLYQVSVRVPPTLDEQVSIANAIGTLDAEMGYTQDQLDHLTTQKRGLMQQLLMGAVRVKY